MLIGVSTVQVDGLKNPHGILSMDGWPVIRKGPRLQCKVAGLMSQECHYDGIDTENAGGRVQADQSHSFSPGC